MDDASHGDRHLADVSLFASCQTTEIAHPFVLIPSLFVVDLLFGSCACLFIVASQLGLVQRSLFVPVRTRSMS